MVKEIIHLLHTADILNLTLSTSFLIYYIVLIIIYKKFKGDKKLWNLLCFIPLVISIIHLIIFVFGSAFLEILPNYLTIYVPAILISLMPLLTKKKITYNIGKTITIILCIIASLIAVDSLKITNYTRKSLSKAYIALCDKFEKEYILKDWKKIDYKKLKEEGLVLVKEAEKTDDINKYYEALDNFVKAHNDGHMGVNYKTSEYLINKIKSFNDYGLSLITLDDGTTIAINVEENLEIKEGDTITKWNGEKIEDAIKNVNPPMNEGVLENEKILKTFYLSGVGGEKVEVTYINSKNEEKTVTLNKLDSELSRALKSYSTYMHSHNDNPYEYKMLNDNTGYLKIGKEKTDTISDTIAYMTGNHKKARKKFRKSLQELREQGMTRLVIDARNNGGGFDEVATALASLFTKEKMYAFSLGHISNNRYIKETDHYVLSDGEFSDIEVLVLTNLRCASAGDGLILYLSRIDGITVAGLSNPAGINQETGGIVYMPEGVNINYPTGLILNQEGVPSIDVTDARISRNPVDIKIPLDKESAIKLFSGEDYELEWAIDYLNKIR